MSSSSPKSGKKSSGILAFVKRRKSRKEKPQDSAPSQLQPPEQIVQEVPILEEEATAMTDTKSQEDLSRQLAEAFEDLDLAESKIEEDTKKIQALENQIDTLHKKSSKLESKVLEMEKVSAELDDASFDAAQEFQYKKQIEELQEQLEERKNLEQQLSDTKLELQEIGAQYDTVKFQQQRSTTRDKMKSLSEEKSSREEVIRLQKDLRGVERQLKQQQATYEAKLKANQDSIQRVQDKNKAIQKRCDEMEKERLQLKVERSRLEKKLEKSGSYAEQKRIKTEQEAAEMEVQNIKRKHAKLEKRLSMSTQMLDMIGQGSSLMLDRNGDSSTSPISELSPSSSGFASPVPTMTLSEARIDNLERELYQLEQTLTMTNEENQNLKGRAATAERNVENLTKRLKEIDSELFHEKEANSSLEMEADTLRQQATTPTSPIAIGDDNSLETRFKKLEKETQQSEIRFRVKEKDLWATIEAQKRQISELEIEKITLEERLLEDEATDVEDDDSQNKPSAGSINRIEELEQQLHFFKVDNEELRAEIEKLQAEAREIMESLEAELGDSTDGGQSNLIQQNADMKKTLEDKSEQYVETIREIARLKNIIEDQVTCCSLFYYDPYSACMVKKIT